MCIFEFLGYMVILAIATFIIGGAIAIIMDEFIIVCCIASSLFGGCCFWYYYPDQFWHLMHIIFPYYVILTPIIGIAFRIWRFNQDAKRKIELKAAEAERKKRKQEIDYVKLYHLIP